MKKIICITGASAGFGKATAEIFAKNGHDLIISARRKEKIDSLAGELTRKYNVDIFPIELDVRNQLAVKTAFQNLPENWKKIDVLINNAGLASGFDKIQDGNIDDWEKMLDTNVKGLLYVSNQVIPLMIAQKKGHIINIGSTASKEVYLKGNVYCASKHAVDALTKGMRIDLLEHGIKVTQIAPGAAETEFSEVRFYGDKEKAKNVYQGFKPMTSEDIAGIIYYTTTLPEHLCINDLVVTSLAQANSVYIHKE
ncbi:MAG: SDR family NAD(P)-dependent oxidoreductase [Flavobacteriaceae bacterium]|nr:SDR family NAD(P)-dependent oxidoreductase [Flavobacteriaceae bacterium]